MPDVGKILVQQGHITSEQYLQFLDEIKGTDRYLEDAIIASGYVNKTDVLHALAQEFGWACVDLGKRTIPPEILKLIPENLSRNYKLIAIDIQGNELHIAIADPRDAYAREAVGFISREQKKQLKFFLTDEEGLRRAQEGYATLSGEVGEALTSVAKAHEGKERANTFEIDETNIKNAPVAKMVSVIFRHAVEGKASDIHIEPLFHENRVRYRLEGKLQTSLKLPLHVHTSIVTRIKVMSNMKIDETRKPQDGRIRMHIQDRDVDFRVSVLPLQAGLEKVVIRILDLSGRPPTMEELGYAGRAIEITKRNIRKPNGLFLVTGPTGCGKSTTLVSALQILNNEDVNISTLEDPVEYKLEGVNHSQIHPEIGYSFATGLRSLLRQDPDIIMVGEIRDQETAELSIHAALTGHIVLSTLHTNDSVGAVPRLIDTGVQPFLLASSLNFVLAQRLVRKIHEDCKEPLQLDPEIQRIVNESLEKVSEANFIKYEMNKEANRVFYRGKGCDICGQSGYKGRTAITELFEVTSGVRNCILTGFHEADVARELLAQDFLSMEQDGFIKALQGKTTVEEVVASTKQDF